MKLKRGIAFLLAAVFLFGTLALMTLGYFVFHMTLAAWLFRKKEF
jgi:ABC-2 type transport system permease protein